MYSSSAITEQNKDTYQNVGASATGGGLLE